MAVRGRRLVVRLSAVGRLSPSGSSSGDPLTPSMNDVPGVRLVKSPVEKRAMPFPTIGKLENLQLFGIKRVLREIADLESEHGGQRLAVSRSPLRAGSTGCSLPSHAPRSERCQRSIYRNSLPVQLLDLQAVVGGNNLAAVTVVTRNRSCHAKARICPAAV